jgi:hypothetical protein
LDRSVLKQEGKSGRFKPLQTWRLALNLFASA